METIIELRRYEAVNRKDTKRVMQGYGRYRETPDEIVADLTPAGYVVLGDKDDVRGRDAMDTVRSLLSAGELLTIDQISQRWPDESGVRAGVLRSALKRGIEAGLWVASGKGVKGDPVLYATLEH